jgi:hypothetical protein
LRQRAYHFVLSGSYWFGMVALFLHLADYAGYGIEQVRKGIRWHVNDLWELSHDEPWQRQHDVPWYNWGVPLRQAWWGLPEQLVFAAVGLAALGVVLALVAFALRWKNPIPSALALLLNLMPSLLAIGVVYLGSR